MVNIILIDVPSTYTERIHQQKFNHLKLLFVIATERESS